MRTMRSNLRCLTDVTLTALVNGFRFVSNNSSGRADSKFLGLNKQSWVQRGLYFPIG